MKFRASIAAVRLDRVAKWGFSRGKSPDVSLCFVNTGSENALASEGPVMRTGRPKRPLTVTEEERERLQSLAHRSRSQALLARRARVVLVPIVSSRCINQGQHWHSSGLSQSKRY
jgi:hypothetical protein